MPFLRACLMMLPLLWPWPGRATPGTAVPGSEGQLCRAAITVVEREAGLPPRLMVAIAKVESGRRDAASGTTQAWPWTINAEGRGSFYPDKAAAIAAVQALQAQGVRSIDVGCMQINLRHHPNAFASLDEAFDPLANARYGARFLTELKANRPEWLAAAGAYHSQTEEYAAGYRQRVAAAWAAEQSAPVQAATYAPPVPAAVAAPVPAFRPGQAGGGFMLSNGAEHAPVIANANPGSGRGLDAYRAAPIPLTGRFVALAPRRL